MSETSERIEYIKSYESYSFGGFQHKVRFDIVHVFQVFCARCYFTVYNYLCDNVMVECHILRTLSINQRRTGSQYTLTIHVLKKIVF